MSLRSGFVTYLKAKLPTDWVIVGNTVVPDGIRKPTLSLFASTLSPLDTPGAYAVTFDLDLMTPVQDPAKADDALDDLLTTLLGVLWNDTSVLIQQAQRSVFAETYEAWKVTLTKALQIEV
jgi:hypothetical protein